MKTPLIPKGSNFTQTHQNLMLRIQSVRRKNDQYQLQCAQQLDSAMAQQILEEKSIMDNEIEQTRKMIDEMDNLFKEPPQKNKLKQTRKEYEKQLNRYKQISESLMEKSVIKAELRDSFRKSLPNRNRQSQERTRQVGPSRQSVEHIAQQQQVDIDFDMEHNILMSRKNELGNVEQHMQKVYAIHQEQANLVSQQGNMIDIIGQEMLKAQENVEGANENIVEAEIQQKKSKKKCYILIFIVLIAVILLAGAYFILRPT